MQSKIAVGTLLMTGLAALFACACGSAVAPLDPRSDARVDEPLGDAAGTSNSDGDGDGDGDGGEGACNPLDLSGVPDVKPESLAAAAPEMTGGVVVPGRYVLTRYVEYFPGGVPRKSKDSEVLHLQEVQEIGASRTHDHLRRVVRAATRDVAFTGSWSTVGNVYSIVGDCPKFANKFAFSADGATVSFAFTGGAVSTFVQTDGGSFVDAGYAPFTGLRFAKTSARGAEVASRQTSPRYSSAPPLGSRDALR